MKPKSLCLCVLIVAFLLASEMPRVHGIFLPFELLGFAAKELNSLIRGIATGVSGILLSERSTMQPIQIVLQNLELEKDERMNRESQTYVDTYSLQEPDTSDENKETESSTKNNESENGNNSNETDTTNEDKMTDTLESEKNESQSGNNSQEDNSQKTDGTDEEKETDSSAEKNGSGSKEGGGVSVETANTQKSDNSQQAEKSSEKQESIENLLNLDNFVKTLIKSLKKCEFKQSKNKQKSYSNILCRW
uniref:Uncharacterized protein n=1 Tax=Bactrocera latifrons TaxID=174628 RepID=A0A0K8WDI4_BACLA